MQILQFVITLAVAAFVSYAVSKACVQRWGGSFVKLCAIGMFLSVLITAISALFYGLGGETIRTIILCGVFLYVSYGDIKTHTADDFNHIIVLSAALICKPVEQISGALLTAAVLAGILLLVAVLVKGAGIGGADMKFSVACAFLTTTLSGGLVGLGLGTFVALIFNSPFRKKEGAGKFPMLPYLSCSYMLVYLLAL